MIALTNNSLGRNHWVVRFSIACSFGCLLAFMAAIMVAAETVSTEADADGPAQTAYAPDSGRGRLILLVSGQTGPTSYKPYAAELAKLGYYVVLLDGKDILNPQQTGAGNFKKAFERAQRSPNTVAGKAAVIGFSLGGGGALYHAASQPDLVSMVVAYYPYTRTWAKNIGWFVKRFGVPVLVLAAQKDRYKDCCVIEVAQAMAAAAKDASAKFELVVYPDADHGFNLQTGARGEPMGAYRADDDRDAWRRTQEMLKQYHPVK